MARTSWAGTQCSARALGIPTKFRRRFKELTMRLVLTAAAASLAIVTAACQKPAENAEAPVNNMADAALANDVNLAEALAPMAATDFAATIAGSDMFEIASGKLAQASATNPKLKAFGAMLVTDHNKSTADLKAAAAAATPAVTLPAAMPAELEAKLDALKAAKGADFDALFLEQQKDGHGKALDALKSYSSGGDVASLKAFADKATPVVQTHLDALNAIEL
jgi:putative membrane protein